MRSTITRTHERHHVLMGDFEHPQATKTRIVHISDTHNQHVKLLANKIIPDGDILVHSGDFGDHSFPRRIVPHQELRKLVGELNTFFGSLPHKHKIFVPGNHDATIDFQSRERIQSLLSSCIYLQDLPMTLEGLKFYGSGWNLLRGTTCARSFSVQSGEISKYWRRIPTDTEILVTHSPPYAILDCSYCKKQGGVTYCQPGRYCGHEHIGCPELREVVLDRVKPAAHLFGHNHGGNYTMAYKDTLFSNAAMCARPVPVVIDYYRK